MFATGAEWTVATTESATTTVVSAAGAGSAWLFGAGVVDDQCAAVEGFAIESFYSFARVIWAFHFDEAEAFRHACEFVSNDPHGSDRTIRGKQLMELFFSCAERKASDVQFFI